MKDFKDIIDQFADMGGLQVSISGGEAFLHPDIMEMLEYCRGKDLEIAILSNLTIVPLAYIESLKLLNLACVSVSLYSVNDDIHDRITSVKGSCRKTKENIKLLHGNGIPITISCPLTTLNKDEYPAVYAFGQNLGLRVQTDVLLMAKSDLDTSNLSLRIGGDDAESVINQILSVTPNANVESPRSADSTNPLCAAGRTTLCIMPNGDCCPCSGWSDYVVGNVKRTPLKEIWNNSQRLIELRTVNRLDFNECNDCEAVDYCSICLARNYNESGGDMLKLNPFFCDYAKLQKEITLKRYPER